MNVYARCFRWFVVLGIVQDLVMALPGVFFPRTVLGVLGIEVEDAAWPAFAALLLVLLSLFYIPAAIDPYRFKLVAVLTVLARLAGVIFFFVLYPGRFPVLFGLIDLAFFVIQGVLLMLAYRTGPQSVNVAPTSAAAVYRFVLRAMMALLVIAAVLGFLGWYKLFRQEPQEFGSLEEQFKYGSIGTEAKEGVPYWIWRVLPAVFPEHLPRPELGYAGFGIVSEANRDAPVGFSKKVIGFPRIGINCALCHTGTYRTASDQEPTVVVGAPSNRLDVQRYVRFLSDCAADSRFTADILLQAIEKETTLSRLDRFLYRAVIIPQTKKGLLEQKARFAWTDHRTRWGRGRIDPFNPVKFHQLGMNPYTDPSIGNSDMMPLWSVKSRQGKPLHWDGLNTSLSEVVLSGAIGDGATPGSLPVTALKRLEDWIVELPHPTYPYPDKIDWALAKRGDKVYSQHCAVCHQPGGARFGAVIPLDEVRTDRHRLDMWSQEAADRYNAFAPTYPWRFRSFVKTNGYVAVPLDGLWLRAPYLHNGSVPTLEDLLEPSDKRPTSFYRGYDVYDRLKVGFVTQGPEAEQQGYRFDVREPGNGNRGHEGAAFGTTLGADDKRALVEFLKLL